MDLEDDDDDLGELNLVRRGQKRNKISETAQKYVAQITEQALRSVEYNGHLDPQNKARNVQFQARFSNVQFDNFLMKNKNKDQRIEVFDVLRARLQTLGLIQIYKIDDKLPEQTMVIRVIQKVQNSLNQVIIEDESSRAKMEVTDGLVCIGLICAVKVKWVDGIYRLMKLIDLSEPIRCSQPKLSANMGVYRVLMVKGPFRATFSKQDRGINIITSQLRELKRTQNILIDSIIVFGPLLSKNNKMVRQFALQNRYQQQYEDIVKILQYEIRKIIPNVQITVIPSIDDITNLHPIPQPRYQSESYQEGIKYVSNPCTGRIENMHDGFKMDLINYDLLKYLDHGKVGRVHRDLRSENLSMYLKQPFLLFNTKVAEEPFDEVNFGGLYNDGQYSDVLVFTSNFYKPFVEKIGTRLVVNVGSLGIDYHESSQHYLTILSFYEGEGTVTQRIRVESIAM